MSKVKKNIISVPIKVVMSLLALLFVLVLMLDVPSVQRYITRTVVHQLIKKSGGTLSIDEASFDLYQGISIGGARLLDAHADTLLQIDQLTVSPRSTLLSLIRRPDFSGLSMSGVQASIIRREKDEQTNWENFIASLGSSQSSGASGPSPSLGHLSVSDVTIRYIDEPGRLASTVSASSLEVDIQKMDSTAISIDRIIITEPIISYVSRSHPSSPTTSSTATSTAPPAPMTPISINEIGIIDGKIDINDRGNRKSASKIDLIANYLDIKNARDIGLQLHEFSMVSDDLIVTHLSTERMHYTGNELDIPSLFYRLGDSFGNADIFVSSLDGTGSTIDLRLRGAQIVPAELSGVIPEIQEMIGSSRLMREKIQIHGDYIISPSMVDFRDVRLWINDHHYLAMQGAIDNGGYAQGPMINLEIDELRTDPEDIDRLLSSVDLPQEVRQLGPLSFNGTFDGFLRDFVAQGAIDSRHGDITMDIKFDLENATKDSIAYSGLLALEDFDLAGYTGDQDFGSVSATLNIARGSGTDLAHSSAVLEATLYHLGYRGYTYSDATFAGQLSTKVINGHFTIQDSSLDFSFDGLVDLSRREPVFDFDVKANNIDLCALQLSSFPCQLSFDSDINFRGADVHTVSGYTLLTDVHIQQDDRELRVDRLELNSRRLDNDRMLFTSNSDFMDIRMEGIFDLRELPQYLLSQLAQHHPDHYSVIATPPHSDSISVQDFTYDIRINPGIDTMIKFVDIPLSIADSTHIYGSVIDDSDRLSLYASAPRVDYKGYEGQQITVQFQSTDAVGSLDIKIDSLRAAGIEADRFLFNTNIKNDQLVWIIDAKMDERSRVDIEARSTASDKGYFTEFLYDEIMVDSILWTILPNPGVGIYPGELDIKSLVLTDGGRSVGIKDINKKGIELSMKDFSIEFLNPIIDYDKLYFAGAANVQAKIRNIYEMKDIEGVADIPDFTINGDPFGSLALRASRRDADILDLDLSIEKEAQRLHVIGTYSQEESYLDTDLDINDYPMSFFEYIIPDGISETNGLISVDGKINGYISDISTMKMDVLADVRDAGVRIDYIGAYYRIEQAIVPIDETLIDFSNVILIDELDNTATITGGLPHKFLDDIQADATIRSDRFIALNTTKEDNPLYYGTGVGPVEAIFTGPFDELDMNVTATASRQSSLYIPIQSTQSGYEESFIIFDYKKEEVDSTITLKSLADRLRASGVNFMMNLTFDQDAEVQVIYDEATSNVLIGHGEGDLRVEVKRDGDFTIFGQYNVTSGQYLYTAFNFIAKPFIIDQGGTVTWTGDPINANLDIKARYPGLRAPLDVLLQEYKEGAGVPEAEFTQRRNVDLTLELTESLFSPTINFDISFPDLNGQIKTLADAKIQTLKATENGINNQVVGLMVFRNFLPDNNPFASIGGSDITAVGNNTLTEFLTSQISLLASEYLSQQLGGGIISGIDLELALSQNQYFLDQEQETSFEIVPDEVNLNLRNRFKNDNFVLNIGGNYVRENGLGNLNNYLTGDFSFDWYITEDRRLKLRLYAIYDYDETNVARRQKYGFGINYRKEFGTLSNVSLTSALDQVIRDIEGGETSSNKQ